MCPLFSRTGGGPTWKRLAAIPSLEADPFLAYLKTHTTHGAGMLTSHDVVRLDNHYQWVIFLVIMVVAIVGIWVGACVWRRRYIRKKDRVYALNSNLAHATESGRVVPNGGSSAGSVHVPGPGMFDPAPISSAGIYGEKSEKKKKWTFGGRT